MKIKTFMTGWGALSLRPIWKTITDHVFMHKETGQIIISHGGVCVWSYELIGEF